jgi:hypothetical protein
VSSKLSKRVIIKMVAVFCEASDEQQAAAIMRRVIDQVVNDDGLQFEDSDDREVFERADPNPLEWSRRPVFLSGHSSYALLVDHFWEPEALYHYLMLSLDSDVSLDELPDEWRLLLERSVKIVNLVTPHFAFAWGKLLEDKRNPVGFESLKPASVPKTLLPWTLLGNASNPDAVEELTKLPAYQQETLPSGRLLQAVAVPGQPPDDAFVAGLEKLGLKYQDLLLG